MILPIGKRKRSDGFLLLELMVSICILSGGIILILNSFIVTIRAIKTSEDYFKAGLVLEEKMLRLYYEDIDEASSAGEFSDFEGRFSWGMNVAGPEGAFYREVRLEAIWQENNKKQSLSVSTYI